MLPTNEARIGLAARRADNSFQICPVAFGTRNTRWLRNMPNPGSEVSSDMKLEFAKYLWEEYRYRHDLIWRLLFRVTAVAALLSIVPFTISETAKANAGPAVDLLPALALVLILASSGLLRAEWKRFEPINRDYREAQAQVRRQFQFPRQGRAPDPHAKRTWSVRRFLKAPDVFRLIVYYYPFALFVLAVVPSLRVWDVI
jgi:hypothetical protein